MKDFNSLEYKRSRGAYMAQCTVEYFVALLVTDAFLAKLLTSIGISDSLVGIISSFISLAFVIQLMSIFLVRSKVSTKNMVLFFDTISIFFFMFIYVIPFIPVSQTAKTVLIVISIIMAYVGKYLIYSIYFKWANSFVSPDKRAEYSAIKEIISLLSGMVFTIAAGYVIDKFEGIGNINGGFLFIACATLLLNICNFICIAMIKKEEEPIAEEGASLSDVVKHTLLNKGFRNIVILTVLWDCARYFTIGFLGVFKTNDLLISVFAVQVLNMVANGCRALLSVPFGRYSDKKTFAKGFELALIIAAASFLSIVFTNKSTWYLIVVYTILYNISVAGTNQNSFNITYSYVESKYITQAMAFKNSIGGLCGFGASLLAGKILSFVQSNGNMLFGIQVYGQQILGGISFVLTVIAIIFLRKVVEKQKVMIQ